ncbi:hypothetical protein FC959_10360 [Clostridium botulinum]|nr:hypothetical protein [Clostridium botulinum]
MKKSNNIWKSISILLAIFLVIIILGVCNLKIFFRSKFLDVFRENIFYLINLIDKFKGIIIIFVLIFIYFILKSKFVIRLEKMSCGGLTLICNKPDKILKQSIKNFLNTKRTLFFINPQKDNFYDTINSYYSTYNFIKNEMSTYDIDSVKNELYDTANEMIQALNEFLTNNQSDYKRWYEYLINNDEKRIHVMNIEDIQKEYRKYEEILADFRLVNKKFVKLGKQFDINMDKWNKNEGI